MSLNHDTKVSHRVESRYYDYYWMTDTNGCSTSYEKIIFHWFLKISWDHRVVGTFWSFLLSPSPGVGMLSQEVTAPLNPGTFLHMSWSLKHPWHLLLDFLPLLFPVTQLLLFTPLGCNTIGKWQSICGWLQGQLVPADRVSSGHENREDWCLCTQARACVCTLYKDMSFSTKDCTESSTMFSLRIQRNEFLLGTDLWHREAVFAVLCLLTKTWRENIILG